jgi:hypothetical protein
MDLRSTRATFVRPPRLRISSCPATVALATARTHDRTIMFRLFTSQEEPRRLSQVDGESAKAVYFSCNECAYS